MENIKNPRKRTRTEEDKVLQLPMIITLGGKPHEVKPLVIKDSRVWRAHLADMLASLPKYAKVTSDDPEKFSEALKAIMVGMPDEVCDLVFEYAKDLNREEIEGVATDAEIALAFELLVDIAFPLTKSMTKAMKRVSR